VRSSARGGAGVNVQRMIGAGAPVLSLHSLNQVAGARRPEKKAQ
jgi:hypothetical protein